MYAIVTHTNTDFDALSSLLAATKIYKPCRAYISAHRERNVNEFLTFYGSRLPFSRTARLPEADKLVVTDTACARMLGEYASWAETLPALIIDHHPREPEGFDVMERLYSPYGATVTILVDLLRERGERLTPLEATLMMLGLYEETGSLIFSTVTPEDLSAAQYLLGQGADLGIVSTFMNRPLTKEQIDLLQRLIAATTLKDYNGVPVAVAACRAPAYVHDVSFLAHKVGDLENLSAFFIVVEMEGRIQLVGRSKIASVDTGRILSELGGGGHPTAASATVKGLTLEEVLSGLDRILSERVWPERIARDIMTSPVTVVPEETSVTETKRILMRLGHAGIPVMAQDQRKPVGIATAADLDKALNHDLGHAPVKAFMSTSFAVVSPADSFAMIRDRFVRERATHLLVLDENEVMIGIISPRDLLSAYGEPAQEQGALMEKRVFGRHAPRLNISSQMTAVLDLEVRRILWEAGETAQEMGMKAYGVGGLVRDVLLDTPSVDIDIVVEGDGIAFIQRLSEKWGAELAVHERFKTGHLQLPNGFAVDVATARTEFYQFPAALPDVTEGTIAQDLYRRDFTINAMAVLLNPSGRGGLLDLFNGLEDLAARRIRVLHNLSFVEDPTRILRAFRFAGRFDFEIDDETFSFIRSALDHGADRSLSPARIREELILILKEENAEKILYRMAARKVLTVIDSHLRFTSAVERAFKAVPQVLRVIGDLYPVKEWRLRLSLLGEGMEPEYFHQWLERTMFRREILEEAMEFRRAGDLERWSRLLLESSAPISRWDLLLGGLSAVTIVRLACLTPEARVFRGIRRYTEAIRALKLPITGEDLLNCGISAGPQLGRIMTEIRRACLDRRVKSRDDALSLAQKNA